MREIDFNLLNRSDRLCELRKNPNDLSIIKYTLKRATGLPDSELDKITISVSLIRQRLIFKASPEVLIRILDDLEKLKLNAFSQTNFELIYNLTEFFNKIP